MIADAEFAALSCASCLAISLYARAHCQGRHQGDDVVASLAGKRGALLRRDSHPDRGMRLLHRPERERYFVKAAKAARIGQRVAGETRQQDPEALLVHVLSLLGDAS